ncbi:MAG: endo-1,4-beta-xylanase, partial [Gemmataceae bacterium]
MTPRLAAALLALTLWHGAVASARDRWTPAEARAWNKGRAWDVGCNFLPSSAINQLEMWQADTYDPKTIDRELGWAAGLGFTGVRVFLHHLPYEQDRDGFLKRIDGFLDIAKRHRVGVMLVLFDSCWDPHPKPGKQRAPQAGLHNSGWVQCPGADDLLDAKRHAVLEEYVRGVVARFKDDGRVTVWDVWNEPDNTNASSYGKDKLKREPADKVKRTLPLLEKSFAWARSAGPTQPVTSGVWLGNWADPAKLSATEKVQLDGSDVITFHTYDPLDGVRKCVESLKRYDRPMLCTEFMARPRGSTFDPVLGYLREQRVGAYCWGFVSGKSQTIYPWDSWQKAYSAEPAVWFHDIFRA